MGYLPEWKRLPPFTPWLRKDPSGSGKAWCNFCEVILYPKKENLDPHTERKRHKDLPQKFQKTPRLNDINETVEKVESSTVNGIKDRDREQSDERIDSITRKSPPNELNNETQQITQKMKPSIAICNQNGHSIQHEGQNDYICEDTYPDRFNVNAQQIIEKIRLSTAKTSQNQTESIPWSNQVEISSGVSNSQEGINLGSAEPSESITLGYAHSPGKEKYSFP
ncbi:hypothetical protein QAD02_018417 [Eretmocerus hayati]|uniref:Uncharacterized protein n=1 Tax=Eretmocerus hayati TaxID=131215 RepID=A0ACC2PGT0_9HYME|nr:hypothetical protein QAD02_018417 [Eretmocerus hayati]